MVLFVRGKLMLLLSMKIGVWSEFN